MKILVNDSEFSAPSHCSVEQALELASINPGRIAVAVNNTVVPRDRWTSTLLHDGDKLLVINAVCGG